MPPGRLVQTPVLGVDLTYGWCVIPHVLVSNWEPVSTHPAYRVLPLAAMLGENAHDWQLPPVDEQVLKFVVVGSTRFRDPGGGL